MPPRTLFEKLWAAHVVREAPGEPTLLYIDLHLVHEVTSPQAFEGLRLTGRKVRTFLSGSSTPGESAVEVFVLEPDRGADGASARG